ncbi:PQQ-binding-like beta-propeller repeat protein [Chitinophaga sp. 30R24]|uniref:outer membrane protein assembly factor BamB family protein n=1 Tax=Chitinophaga sp. 30R24 TaxID=3248838 RepID=UPI003B8FA7A8
MDKFNPQISRSTSFMVLLCLTAGSLLWGYACNNGIRDTAGSRKSTPLSSRNWEEYGGGPDQSKYVVLTQISKDNVKQLQVAWTYSTGDSTEYLFNPIVVDNIMYVVAKNYSLVALDAATGKELWIHANLKGITWRGLNYWESKDRKDRRIIFALNNYLQAIDANTGKSIWSFGDHGSVSLKEGLSRDPNTVGRVQSTTPGRVFEDLIILGSSPGENYFSAPGYLRAYNVLTGKLVWTFHTIPQPGEYGYDTWPKDAWKYAGGANTWGEISVDTKRGIAYFPLGSPTYDYYGGDRKGSNLFGNCLLALDARTGKRLWHFQFVHHDLWDYDLTAAPQLITVKHNGKVVDAVAQATKHGFLFVFNRVTGEPLWPIEERPVPKSDMPGEEAWPTQPFQPAIAPFTRHTVTADDLNPYFTAEQQGNWRKRLAAGRAGLFTPPSDKYETFIIPGAVGGANLGNTASDPARGIVYISSQDYPSVFKLENMEEKEARVTGTQHNKGMNAYQQYCQACHGANKAGAAGPSLLELGKRIDLEGFKNTVALGKGQMPGFQHIDEKTVTELYHYLAGNTIASKPLPVKKETPVMPAGPVVATGGVPAPDGPPVRGMGMRYYPPGVDSPAQRYVSDYGLEYPNLMSPVWSSIMAYDLNTGIVKWRHELGQDANIAKLGGKNTGVPIGSQRKGMIVTANGLLFATSKGGKIYAFDAENGEELWSANLPWETYGMPAMYEAYGRQFIVVSATSPFTKESIDRTKEPGALPRSYVVFALPEKIK